jgi:alkylation response protein AidB-like acyl-CoA dehydrogenase
VKNIPLNSVSENIGFTEFLEHFRSTLDQVFSSTASIRNIGINRGMPPLAMRDILECRPLSVFIPEQYNGRGGHVKECLSVLETASYQSLPLSLMIGINGALFLQPLSIYGQESTKERVFDRFVNQGSMGGLMITEPSHGSDALKMQTFYEETDGKYRIKGLKHWAGLTSWADFWLLTARRKDANGELTRDIDFFIHDSSDNGIEILEMYKNLGLYMLPYGKNKIDVTVPGDSKLEPRTTGVTMMLDILHRSRLQFPGMGMGHLRRIMDEAISHCMERFVGGTSLFSYDQVKSRLSRMQASFTVCSAMCAYTTKNAPVEADVSRSDLSANAIKTVITDYMQEAGQSLLQLVGAMGYRMDHYAGQAIVDSRPFQIFEGSNDILYQQISESVMKSMRKLKENNLYRFMAGNDLTGKAAEYLKNSVNFEPDFRMAQRKLVELGKVLGRAVSLNMVIELGEKGYRSDLIQAAIENLCAEIESMLSAYKYEAQPVIVDSYQEDSSWTKFV